MRSGQFRCTMQAARFFCIVILATAGWLVTAEALAHQIGARTIPADDSSELASPVLRLCTQFRSFYYLSRCRAKGKTILGRWM